MAKKSLLHKCTLPVTIALSGIMCFSMVEMNTIRNMSVSAATAASDTALYKSEYNSREEVLQATLDLNDQIAAEGMVLVKNEDDALPLIGTKPRVSVFGYASTHVKVGASNESGDTSAGEARADADLYSSLSDAGFVVNPTTKTFYENTTAKDDNGILGTNADWGTALKKLEYSYNRYSDAAVVMLSDTGSGTSNHSRDYDNAQKALVEYLGQKFDKVILLVNNSYPFELGWAQDADYVDAILIVGQPGNNGFNAVGKILNGEVNPSGHLADLYATDFTVTPSYNNYNPSGQKDDMVQYQDKDGNQLGQTWLYQYEEGIYVGYRYYETMATLNDITVDVESGSMSGEDWYDAHVVYPFGYGLSYTEFEYSDVKISGTISATGKIKATLKVTNVGDVAGKDVVQLYYSAPYDSTTVEKSAVVLGDYTKTDLLKPGESQTISISISAADMASYDYSLNKGVSGKNEGGYILDDGDYVISLRSDSHTVLTDDESSAMQKTINLGTEITTGLNVDTEGNDVHNQFSDVTDTITGNGNLSFDVLSRANMATTTTTAPTAKFIKLTDAEKAEWEKGMRMRAEADDELYDNWATSDGQGGYVLDGNGPASADRPAEAAVTAADLIGKSYDDPLWDTLLDELNVDELQSLFTEGGYGTLSLEYIKLPGTHNMDGPYGWTSTRGDGSWDGLKLGTEQFPLFCSEVMVACTYNKELAYQEGKMVGEQGLWGNAQNGGTSNSWTGFYSPALNIHRSPFDSRGTEYYSEDPVLSGYSAANVALGAQEMGTFVTLKHFAVFNDGQGSYRSVRNTADPSGTSIWVDEQTLREVYLKGFEIAVKTGSATGVMSSFARIGYTYCGVNYALCTEVLRNEWGFKGIVVSDIVFYANQDGEQMVLAGNNLALIKANTQWTKYNTDGTLDVSGGGGVINVLYEYIHAGKANDFNEAFDKYLTDSPKAATALYNALREGAHGIIYAVVNSNAMQVPYGATVNYTNSNTTISGAVAGKEAEAVSLGGAELSTINATYGALYNTPITYTVTDGALPAGMSLDASTGKLTGTPSVAGTYTFTVTASAAGYESASVEYTLSVAGDNSEVINAINGAVTNIDNKIDGIDVSNDNSEVLEAIKNQSSGCGSVIGIGSAALAALVVLGGTFVVLRKKEN